MVLGACTSIEGSIVIKKAYVPSNLEKWTQSGAHVTFNANSIMTSIKAQIKLSHYKHELIIFVSDLGSSSNVGVNENICHDIVT